MKALPPLAGGFLVAAKNFAEAAPAVEKGRALKRKLLRFTQSLYN
jgi:hypothetical protein